MSGLRGMTASYGSRRIVAIEFLNLALPTAAGVAASFAFPVTSWKLSLSLLAFGFLCLCGSAALLHRGGFGFLPPGTRAITQMMLEEYWAKHRQKMIDSGLWDREQHIRFTIYIPMRWMSIGRSRLIPVHFLDSDEGRNTDKFSIRGRTPSGWAGRALKSGNPVIADLDATDSFLNLGLSREEMEDVRKLGLRSKVCQPLMEGKAAVAVLCLESVDPISKTKFNEAQVLHELDALGKVCLRICRTAYWLKEHSVAGPA